VLRFLTAGESHGPVLVAILEGVPSGLRLSAADLRSDLARRQRGYGVGPRMKKIEEDHAEILSGVLAGETTGAPIALLLPNKDHDRWKDTPVEPMTTPRPGHADLTGAIKYAYRDLRFSLERASARETAARVGVGAICRALLAQFDIRVGSYVVQIGSVHARLQGLSYEARLGSVEQSDVRCPSVEDSEAMRAEIRAAMEAKDTLGGVFEVVALGVPPGLGSHVHADRRLGARLAQAMMSIPAIKGVEIGEGFQSAGLRGTQTHDEIYLDDGRLVRKTNRSGGLEGGITTGESLIVRAAMKPISTTLQPRATVDLAAGREAETNYERSDFCSVPRAAVVGEAMMCLVLADALLEKLGGDSLSELRPRFESLRKADLADLPMRQGAVVLWS
jgi:chorismate synthase